jgi:hypothetical protein
MPLPLPGGRSRLNLNQMADASIQTALAVVNNSRLNDLRSHLDARFADMRETWRSDLRRLEEVLDAQLKHLEAR